MAKSYYITQLIVGFAATLSVACAGFHFGWSSPSLPKLLADDSDILITSDQSSWIVSVLTLGSSLGPLIGAALVDRIGRKWSLLLSVIPYVISAILIGLAQGFWWFIAGRFIAGLGTGVAYAVAPMYLGEIADDKIRGTLTAMIGLWGNIGIFAAFCVGPWVSRLNLAILGGALPLAFGLMFVWMPESPYYLIMKNKLHLAEKSLIRLKGPASTHEQMKKIEMNVEFDRKNAGTVRDLVMVPGNRRALLITVGLMLAQQCSGSGAILAYSSLMFEASGTGLDANISVIIFGLVKALGSGVSTFAVDWSGRRPLLLISAGGSAVFLAGEALYFQLQAIGVDVTMIWWLPVTAIIGYVIFYAIGFATLPYVVLSELFPYNVKASATMVTSISGALSGMVVSKLYQIVADAFGIQACFWGFSGLTIISFGFIYFILPETKQRSFRSIQEELHKTTESTIQLEKSVMA